MVKHEIDRRGFLRGAVATSALLIGARSLPSGALAAALDAERHFARVKVARNRVIRTIVGLRPFRSQGFLIEAERLGPKLLVHNYGHGGAGVTLSWGTSSLALDLTRDFVQSRPGVPTRRRNRRFAVLGCGVIGLSTARLLQQRFQDGEGTVTIYAKDLPPTQHQISQERSGIRRPRLIRRKCPRDCQNSFDSPVKFPTGLFRS